MLFLLLGVDRLVLLLLLQLLLVVDVDVGWQGLDEGLLLLIVDVG